MEVRLFPAMRPEPVERVIAENGEGMHAEMFTAVVFSSKFPIPIRILFSGMRVSCMNGMVC